MRVLFTIGSLAACVCAGLAPAAAQSVPGTRLAMIVAQAQPAKPATSAPKPYQPVAVSLPAPFKDPTFEAFRKQLSEAAQKKDRAAIGKLVVAQGFFWLNEDGDKADKKKSGLDNLAAALDLSAKDSAGWDVLAGYASDPTATPYPDKQGVVCSPADPSFDDKALEDLVKSTQTDPADWGYPLADGLEMRATAQASGPVSEKLGMHFVRVMPDEGAGVQTPAPMLRVVAPSGKIGFVSADMIAPLGNDQICYGKDATGWKITGFIGSEQ
jgi:hypothetical protein